MSEKRFFGFAEFSTWVSEKVDGVLASVAASLGSKVDKTDDFGQYKVGELELAVLLADLASGADLATLQQGFNDFVAAKASTTEAIAGTDDAKYLTAVGAKAAIEAAVNDLVGSAPEAMNTIMELATALENNPDVIANLKDLVTNNSTNISQLYVTVGGVSNDVNQALALAAGKLDANAQAVDSAKLEGRTKAQVISDVQTALNLGTASTANIFVSTVDPIAADGKDGDLWIKYTP